MITFKDLIDHARRMDADDTTTHGFEVYRDLIEDAVRDVWQSRDWIFKTKEMALTLVGAYEVGTISATNGSTKITASSSATWSTSWPSLSVIRTGNFQADFNVSNIRLSATKWCGTIDHPWPFSSTSSSYTLHFPYYELPSDFKSIRTPFTSEWMHRVEECSQNDFLDMRTVWYATGLISRFAIFPSDGTTPGRIAFHPSPNQGQIARAIYYRGTPDCRIYASGTASLTNGAAALTGSGTSWTQAGYSLVGKAFQFDDQQYAKSRVSTVNSASGITLSATWGGKTVSNGSYGISTDLGLPEYMGPSLKYAARMKVAEYQKDLNAAGMYQQKYLEALKEAAEVSQPSLEGTYLHSPMFDMGYSADCEMPNYTGGVIQRAAGQ